MYVKTPVSTSWRACRRLDDLHRVARVGRPDVTLGAGSAQDYENMADANADNTQVIMISVMNATTGWCDSKACEHGRVPLDE